MTLNPPLRSLAIPIHDPLTRELGEQILKSLEKRTGFLRHSSRTKGASWGAPQEELSIDNAAHVSIVEAPVEEPELYSDRLAEVPPARHHDLLQLVGTPPLASVRLLGDWHKERRVDFW